MQELWLKRLITRFEGVYFSELRDITKLTDFSMWASIQSFKVSVSKEERDSTGSLVAEKIFIHIASERKREFM